MVDDWEGGGEGGGEATLEEFGKLSGASASRSIGFILDIPLEVTVELGRTSMLINDLLQLGQGSVIELNKLAGEPLETIVNRKLITRGQGGGGQREVRRALD